MRIGFLGSEDSWYFRDLQRAAGTQHNLVPLPFSRLASALQGASLQVTSCDHPLAALDAVLVRSMPPGSLEQIVFRMDALAQLAAQNVLVVNPPRSLEIAVDKYLALAQLQRAGFAVPRTIVCQHVDDAMVAWEQLGEDVVVKPLFGSEGRGITRVTDQALAWRTFKGLSQLGAVLYLQEFIPHEGADLRLLVIGPQVLGMRRRNPLDWRTNVSRGAQAEAIAVEPALADVARRAARAVRAPLAGVDILPARDGQMYLLEVNAVPGWNALARATGADIAAQVLQYLAACHSSGALLW